MTQPVSHGYPDYGRTSARADVLWHDIIDPDIDAQETLPKKFIGDRGYVQFFFSADTNHFDLTFNYYMDAGLTQLSTATAWSCRSGNHIEASDPVKAPWVVVVVTPSAVNSAYTFRMWGTDVPANTLSINDTGTQLYDLDGVSIGAGVTRTDVLIPTYSGPATWRMATNSTNWSSYLEAITPTGAIVHIDRISQDQVSERILVYLPRATCRVRTTNNEAAAKTFFGFVSAHPQGIYG